MKTLQVPALARRPRRLNGLLRELKQRLGGREDLMRNYGRTLLLIAKGKRTLGMQVGALRTMLRAWRAAGSHGLGAGAVNEAYDLIEDVIGGDVHQKRLRANVLYDRFLKSREARAIRSKWSTFPVSDQVRLRLPREGSDPERQGDLIVLKKHDKSTGEKGVILVSYTESIRRFAALFDLERLANDYIVVLEPSWWGYQDPTFLMLVGSDIDVIVQSPWRDDYEFLERLGSNLVPTRLGAGDWVDHELFSAGPPPARRTYDIVMVSSWSPVKRHADLFKALRQIIDTTGDRLKVALIGYPGGWTVEHIRRMAEAQGVLAQCEVFQSITPADVASIVGQSRLYALLSRKEGANRALYEALFCDTPVLVYRHHRGVNTEVVNKDTGVLFEDDTLAESILAALSRSHSFAPRQWALANTGYLASSRKLNWTLRDVVLRCGGTWSKDIAFKKNTPNAVYALPGSYVDFDDEYDKMCELLRC